MLIQQVLHIRELKVKCEKNQFFLSGVLGSLKETKFANLKYCAENLREMQTLPTLNFLETLLAPKKRKWQCLDFHFLINFFKKTPRGSYTKKFNF